MKQGSIKFTHILFVLTLIFLGLGASKVALTDNALPPPNYGGGEEVPLDPIPSEDLPGDDMSLPPPSFGGPESFPDSMTGSQEMDANQKNLSLSGDDEDHIFLPAPVASDSMSSAPIALPYNNRNLEQRDDWYSATKNRPVFSLSGGLSSRNYPTNKVPDRITGYNLGASYRLFDLGQTIFLHAFAGLSFFDLGNVNGFPDVRDTTLHYGPMVEMGVGRRISLFGSLLRRSNTIRTGINTRGNPPLSALTGVGEDATWRLGLGAQFDFYVIPHGSIGIRAHIEQDIYQLAFTMAIEPRPRKKLDLNFENP